MTVRLPVRAMLEFALYGPDLQRLETFYRDVFGLELIARVDGRLVALRCGHSTLLLFDPTVTRAPGAVPQHGADGAGHVAFVIDDDERHAWRQHLQDKSVDVEREVDWPEGGTSLYLRDPAGNSVELAPPTIWDGLGRRLIDRGS